MSKETGYVAIQKDGLSVAVYAENISQLIYELGTNGNDLDDYEIYEVGERVVAVAQRWYGDN